MGPRSMRESQIMGPLDPESPEAEDPLLVPLQPARGCSSVPLSPLPVPSEPCSAGRDRRPRDADSRPEVSAEQQDWNRRKGGTGPEGVGVAERGVGVAERRVWAWLRGGSGS